MLETKQSLQGIKTSLSPLPKPTESKNPKACLVGILFKRPPFQHTSQEHKPPAVSLTAGALELQITVLSEGIITQLNTELKLDQLYSQGTMEF